MHGAGCDLVHAIVHDDRESKRSTIDGNELGVGPGDASDRGGGRVIQLDAGANGGLPWFEVSFAGMHSCLLAQRNQSRRTEDRHVAAAK